MSQRELNGKVDRSVERAVRERKRSIDAAAVPDPATLERGAGAGVPPIRAKRVITARPVKP